MYPVKYTVARGRIFIASGGSGGKIRRCRGLAFRITPDIARETGAGASLSGSAEYRLKYAYGQLSLDDWLPRGSWVRLGIQQTPFVDFQEGIYRYRFQGTVFRNAAK